MTDITLLDGGMGQELVHRAGDRPTPLWSTQVMMELPGLVSEVHRDFFNAGATVATTNTYAIHRDRLVPTGIEDQFSALIDMAIGEAETARSAHGSGRIAGSIGPLGASYRSDLHPDFDVAVPLYAEIANQLRGHVDLIICETVVSVLHARSILTGAQKAGVPVWLGVSVDDENGSLLRSGETVSDAAAIAQDLGAQALLVNCSAPEAMPAALAQMAHSGLPFGAYANGFTQISKDFLKDRPTVAALSARHDFTPETYADQVMTWIDHGATIVGGCCEVSPAHIAEIARRLRGADHTIV